MQNQRSVLLSMLALPRGGTTAPTTPLLHLIIAYSGRSVNMKGENVCGSVFCGKMLLTQSIFCAQMIEMLVES